MKNVTTVTYKTQMNIPQPQGNPFLALYARNACGSIIVFQSATLCKQISTPSLQMWSKNMWLDNPLKTAHVGIAGSKLFQIKS